MLENIELVHFLYGNLPILISEKQHNFLIAFSWQYAPTGSNPQLVRQVLSKLNQPFNTEWRIKMLAKNVVSSLRIGPLIRLMQNLFWKLWYQTAVNTFSPKRLVFFLFRKINLATGQPNSLTESVSFKPSSKILRGKFLNYSKTCVFSNYFCHTTEMVYLIAFFMLNRMGSWSDR